MYEQIDTASDLRKYLYIQHLIITTLGVQGQAKVEKDYYSNPEVEHIREIYKRHQDQLQLSTPTFSRNAGSLTTGDLGPDPRNRGWE
jgi:hypothetical protein